MRIDYAAALLASVLMTATASLGFAQGPLMQPAAFTSTAPPHPHSPMGGPSDFVDAYGNPAVMPVSYGAPCGPSMGGPSMGGCYPGGGCYGGGGGYGGGMTGGNGDPFGGAYLNTEQCGPHYFDFSAEYLHYRRDSSGFGGNVVYSLNGFANEDPENVAIDPDSFGGDAIALQGSDLGGDELNGYRLAGRIDLGGLSVAEFTYSGLYEDEEIVANQNGTTRLFSVYSLWGTATNGDFDADGTSGPPTGANFAETANADQHRLDYSSELHTAEATFRRYWVGYNPRVSGTVLIGFRYTNLSEELTFSSMNAASGNTLMLSIGGEADNDLAGVQVGGDGWITLLQGLRIGGEAKVGLFNNNFRVSNTISSVNPAVGPSGQETVLSGDQVAFLTEAKLSVVADLTPCWSLRGGYEVLFISDVALMNDSVAFAQPYGDINNISQFTPAEYGPSTPASDDGEVFYHGFHAGLEYVW